MRYNVSDAMGRMNDVSALEEKLGAQRGRAWYDVQLRLPIDSTILPSCALGTPTDPSSRCCQCHDGQQGASNSHATDDCAYDAAARHLYDGLCESEECEVHDERECKRLPKPLDWGLRWTMLRHSRRSVCGVLVGMFRI